MLQTMVVKGIIIGQTILWQRFEHFNSTYQMALAKTKQRVQGEIFGVSYMN